MRPIYQRPGM